MPPFVALLYRDALLPSCSIMRFAPGPSCLRLARRSPGFLFGNVVFRVDLKEVVDDDQEHRCASEEDRKRVELIVGNHFGRAFVM